MSVDIFEKSSSLIRFWARIQFPAVIGFCLSIPIFLSIKEAAVIVFLIWISFIWLFGCIGTAKASAMLNLYRKASRLMEGHKDEILTTSFKKMPKYLHGAVILDVLLPVTFPFSFLLKILFYRRLLIVRYLMGLDRELYE